MKKLAAVLALVVSLFAVAPASAGISYPPPPDNNLIMGVQTPPAGLGWDFVSHPVNVFRLADGRYGQDVNPLAVPSIAPLFSPTLQAQAAAGTAGGTLVTYADAAAADNSANGTSPTTPKQGIRQAIAVCETSNATYCLTFVKPGDYARSSNFNQGSTAPTKVTGIVCAGAAGECIVSSTQKGLAWTSQGGGVYTTTRANTTWVMNEVALDRYGDRNPFVAVASAAAVASCTVDCAFLDTSTGSSANTLTIKRADGAAPTDANTRVLLLDGTATLGTKSFYASGFTFLGGSGGTISKPSGSSPSTQDIVIADSYLGYAGGIYGVGPGQNAVALWDFNGLAYLLRPTIAKATADALNPHMFLSTPSHADWLVADPVIRDVGRTGSLSNNCLTGHDGSSGTVPSTQIVLNLRCTNPAGGAIRPIGFSQIWLAGGGVDGDRGDTQFTDTGGNAGTVPSTCITVENSARVFAQDFRCSRNLVGVNVSAGATFGGKRLDLGGGKLTGAGLNADGTYNGF